MVAHASALHERSNTIEFRTIAGDRWPIETGRGALVLSLLVFNHLSSTALMEAALAECGGRVLGKDGHAILGLQTMTLKGEIAQWCLRAAGLSARPRDDIEMRRKLLDARRGEPVACSHEEIVGRLMHMEFRRCKSVPLRRLRHALRSARRDLRKTKRFRSDGTTLIVVRKL